MIAVNSVSVLFGATVLFEDISFVVNPKERVGLVGKNGAGKSTLMRMIYCRSPLTSGTLRVVGLDVNDASRTIRGRVGIVPQENNLDPDITVRENLLVYARYYRIPRQEAEERADRLIA